jgi:hypothetical protein
MGQQRMPQAKERTYPRDVAAAQASEAASRFATRRNLTAAAGTHGRASN